MAIVTSASSSAPASSTGEEPMELEEAQAALAAGAVNWAKTSAAETPRFETVPQTSSAFALLAGAALPLRPMAEMMQTGEKRHDK
mmetsp:Transcript_107551/g.343085  ORF Transcript_107551/g.343085 Transcript_107551/m.343085 type:complete len:85 (+) Transcript_107551:5601-5855(+)